MFIYKTAAAVLKKVQNHKGSLKNLVYGSNCKNPKQLYALLFETLKYYNVLEEILEKTQLMKNAKGFSKQLVILLLYDFLFGKGIQCSGKLKQFLTSRKSMIHSALVRIKVKRKVVKNEELAVSNPANSLPKYLRVNTLKANLGDIKYKLLSDGYVLVDNQICKKKEYVLNKFINTLLMFHPQTDFHDNTLYLQGNLIFQDLSSCIPSQVLSPPCDSKVIDACSAPGNKTSHLAALMKNTGKIFAVELNHDRLQTMKSMLKKADVQNCETVHSDFLKVLSSDCKYSQVTHILVDPSCSGSGMVNRLDYLIDNADKCPVGRLKSLSQIQFLILNHALSFPKVKRVVYSTCSIHSMENEGVVKRALDKNPHFSLQSCLPNWSRRGNAVEGLSLDDALKCIRCEPNFDRCNGFFVALFQRNTE